MLWSRLKGRLDSETPVRRRGRLEDRTDKNHLFFFFSFFSAPHYPLTPASLFRVSGNRPNRSHYEHFLTNPTKAHSSPPQLPHASQSGREPRARTARQAGSAGSSDVRIAVETFVPRGSACGQNPKEAPRLHTWPLSSTPGEPAVCVIPFLDEPSVHLTASTTGICMCSAARGPGREH